MSAVYWALVPQSQWDGSTYLGIADQIIGGTMPYTGVVYGTDTTPYQAVPADFFFDEATGLSEGTNYHIAAVWSDGVNESNVSVSSVVTTLGAASGGATVPTLGAISADAITANSISFSLPVTF